MARTRHTSLARSALDRVRQDRGLDVLTTAAMLLFVLVVYVIVVIGGGAFLGRTSPSLWLSVLATAIVAMAFDPVRRAVRQGLARTLHQDRLTPYQVLSRFPATISGSYPAEELPLRMAKVLAEGTGTARAELWLVVHGRLELAAKWPPDDPATIHTATNDRATNDRATNDRATNDRATNDRATNDRATNDRATNDPAPVRPPKLGLDRPGDNPSIVIEGPRHSLSVRERGELLGALTVVLRDGQRLAPVEERLFAGLAAQSGLMLRVAGLRAELGQQLVRLERRSVELRRARRDLVARQDAERQRLERNIHDGAQQELIALLVNLRLSQTLLGRAPERAARLLVDQAAAARDTIATLTALSRGLYPKLLTDDGPVAALRAAVASSPIPVDVTATEVPRCAAAVEAAVYFCCLEAVQNATKHSGATLVTITIRGPGTADRETAIELTISDDGRGFDINAPSRGGLANIRDRIESLRGSVTVTSEPGHGSTVRAMVPIDALVRA